MKEIAMRHFVIATAIACLFGLSSFAHAGKSFHSPAIYAGYDQDDAECWIRNTGTTPITVEVRIFDESGNTPPIFDNTVCRSPVQPGYTCVAYANDVPNGQAFACSATLLSGNRKVMRGMMMLKTAVGEPLESAELR
jgi:hypothetical protein